MPYTVGTWLRGVAANWSKWQWLYLRFIYIPSTGTDTAGSVHMGFLYDQYDTVPSTALQMTSLSRYTSGPVWSGSEASSMLSNPSMKCPPGAICCELDVTRLEKPWYSYVNSADFTAAITVNSAIGNIYSPSRLVVLSADGVNSTAVACGRVMVQYGIKLIEPITSALNQ